MTTLSQPIEPESDREAEKTAPPAPPAPSRYERLWDDYSRFWDEEPSFRSHRFLGDEWGSDDWIRYNVETFAAPYLRPESRALEIGPGGGRYTIRVAPLCHSLVAVDVSGEMIRRCRSRLGHLGHVTFVKGSGTDLAGIPDSSVDFAFSFNVFVQLTIEDVFGYLVELKRVLAPGGVATLHYASLSGEEGWKHFLARRKVWSADPLARGRFGELTLATMDLLADRAGLAVLRNQPVARDAVVVLSNSSPAYPVREREGGLAPTRRDFRHVDRYLDELAEDVYHELPTEHHEAAAHDAIERMIGGLDVKSAIELGCGAGPCLDKLADMGVEVAGISLGAEHCEHPVVNADVHFSTLPEGSADLVVARHVVEHSPMPLLLLMEMHRITRRYALVVVPCDEEIWIDWRNHYSVLSKPMWRKLFRRARFAIRAEEDGPLEPKSTEWRFLLEKA